MPEPTPNPRPPDDDSLIKESDNWFSLQIVLLICRITPKCPEVARILSEGMDRPLPLLMRLRLRIHYLMCSFCERYAKHLRYLRETARTFPEHAGDCSTETLPPDAKERLKQALRNEPGHK